MGGSAQTQSFTRTESNSQFQYPHTTFSPDSRLPMEGVGREQFNPFYGGSASSHSENMYQPDPGPVYDEARIPVRHPLVGGHSMSPYSAPKEGETTFTNNAPLESNSPPTRTSIVQPYQKPISSTGNLTRLGASNPMWLKDDHSGPQNIRRFSEGTPTNNPSRTNCSCLPMPSIHRHHHNSQNMSDSTDGKKVPLHSTTSAEDTPTYSRLNHNGGPTGYVRRSDPPPNPNWYRTSSIVSDDSFYRSGPGTIKPYETVRNSQIQLSPDETQPTSSNTTRNLGPPKRISQSTPNDGQSHLSIPCASDSIPSLPRMRENTHFERILV